MHKSSFFKYIRIRPLDVIILTVFAAVLFFSILALRNTPERDPVLIIDSPFGQYIYELDKDREVKIKGLIGISVIKIENGKAKFDSSPCPNQTCVSGAPISKNFEWLACMPNQVFIHIEDRDVPHAGGAGRKNNSGSSSNRTDGKLGANENKKAGDVKSADGVDAMSF